MAYTLRIRYCGPDHLHHELGVLLDSVFWVVNYAVHKEHFSKKLNIYLLLYRIYLLYITIASTYNPTFPI